MDQALIFILILLVLVTLSIATNKNPEIDKDGKYVLLMHRFYLITGVVSFLLGVTIASICFFADGMDAAAYIIIAIMFGFFGVFGIYYINEYRFHKVVFDENKIQVFKAYSKEITVNWNEIESGKFNSMSWMLVLKNKNGTKIKIHLFMIGFPKFVEILSEKTDLTEKILKIPNVKSFTN